MKLLQVLEVLLVGAAVVGCAMTAGAESEKKKAARKKRRAAQDAASYFTGTTPQGSTKWVSDSVGSIYTYVDTSHLNFDRVPHYMCDVVKNERKNPFLPVNITSVVYQHGQSTLANVTGKHTPMRVSNSGFRVRLKFKPEVGRNLTDTTARLEGWRVRWIAITGAHSILDDARVHVVNKEYDEGIEEKPVGQHLASLTMLDRLVNEDPQIVNGMLGLDFEVPESKQPKPPKKKVEKPAKDDTEGKDGEKKDSEENKGDDGKKEDKKEDKKEETATTE
mmetsp:Transcript_20508/g.33876  ORF Transcript_20508/g.33876 Transcript_20508/m.33876 type:complete len:277 (-) Transcript_20508:1430-2260(-)